jgi:hypothetical protein
MASSVEVQSLAYFISKGLTPAQAAGIVGNFKQESGLNPQAAGGGLDQGQGSRFHGGTLQQQLDGIWSELVGSERNTLAALKRASSPEEAARIFSNLFERPGIPALSNRERYAREAYNVTKSQKGFKEIIPGESKIPLLGSLFEGAQGAGEKVGKAGENAVTSLPGVGGALKGLGGVEKIGETIVGWVENPLTPIKFVAGAVLLYVGVRTLTGGTGPARETSKAFGHAAELAAVIPK